MLCCDLDDVVVARMINVHMAARARMQCMATTPTTLARCSMQLAYSHAVLTVQTRQVITNKKIQIKVPQWADVFNGPTVLAWACDGGEAITHARLVEKSQGCMHVRNKDTHFATPQTQRLWPATSPTWFLSRY
jgi:hypothetical protein